MSLVKTHLQHVLTSVAINVVPRVAWLQGQPHVKTRRSHFAALAQRNLDSTIRQQHPLLMPLANVLQTPLQAYYKIHEQRKIRPFQRLSHTCSFTRSTFANNIRCYSDPINGHHQHLIHSQFLVPVSNLNPCKPPSFFAPI